MPNPILAPKSEKELVKTKGKELITKLNDIGEKYADEIMRMIIEEIIDNNLFLFNKKDAFRRKTIATTDS